MLFLGALSVFASLEALFPRKSRTYSRATRWLTNVGFTLINTVVVKLMGPVVAISSAYWATENGWGVFNIYEAQIPVWLAFGAGLILLDLAIYGQHVATHKIAILWRLHKVHHADRDIDVTTGFRFHPLEIALSMFYKVGVVLALGPSVMTVLVFETVLSVSALFNHSNLLLPSGVDKVLRVFIVTPDMHRVHHSIRPEETDSNYGFNLSVWDRLFGTFIPQPRDGHDHMRIGLSDYQSDAPTKFTWSLFLPFKR